MRTLIKHTKHLLFFIWILDVSVIIVDHFVKSYFLSCCFNQYKHVTYILSILHPFSMKLHNILLIYLFPEDFNKLLIHSEIANKRFLEIVFSLLKAFEVSIYLFLTFLCLNIFLRYISKLPEGRT